MSSGVSIPGVTDKYGTKNLVEQLMKVERVPLEREKTTLETYKNQQSAWRSVNQKMSSLRESVKNLYSFDNPFNNKLASTTDEDAVTVDAGREADYGDFKLDVLHPATADRYLSGNIDKNMDVPGGKYSFQVGKKTIDINWKGGKLTEFVNAINKRGGTTLKASLIGISPTKQALLIESLVPGLENRLVFKEKSLSFAKQIDMIQDAKPETINFSSQTGTYSTTKTVDTTSQKGMPSISKSGVKTENEKIVIPPRNGFEIAIPKESLKDKNSVMTFSFKSTETKDITDEINNTPTGPVLPSAGGIDFNGITISNNPSETSLKIDTTPKEKLNPITDDNVFFIKNEYGIEVPIDEGAFSKDSETGETTVSIKLSDYQGAKNLIVRNSNTGKEITMTVPHSYDATKALGYEATHAISTADDAVIKYEGITITRSTNDIDDVVPHVTLHLHEPTEKTATVSIKPDTESAKDALIEFVGKYNQVIAEMNILTSKKEDVVNELEYLSDDEIERAKERLGMFQGDFTLTNGKSSLQRIVQQSYSYTEGATITMLSQLGISTNASSGSSGYNASQLRGYLEIDEKKLDSTLETGLDQIKNMFGYDSDGDLIIDSGIGYLLDKTLTSWVQSGGIISTKTNSLDSKISTSEKKISTLEDQMDKKEKELRSKYSSMEGTLNSLESQQSTIDNFNKQNSNGN